MLPAIKRLRKTLAVFDPSKLPIGAVADLMYSVRETKAVLGRLTEPLTELLCPLEKLLEEHFVQTLKVGESSGVQGATARVQLNESAVPVVRPEDWEAVWAWIFRTKSYDLLPRSLKTDAVRERWDAKKQIPKVSAYHVKKVSCTKLSGGRKRV
jgi:hypothetical protein